MNKEVLIARVRRWPLILVGTILLLVFLGIATIRESYRGWKVDQEIASLESQASALEGRNGRLKEIAEMLQTPESVEVEARRRLGMRQTGEQVVVLKGVNATSGWESRVQLDVVAEAPTVEFSNPQKWFQYFFKSRI